MYKIRFNLGRGERYMTWKITHPDKSVEYLQPNTVSLIMGNCKLHNDKKTSVKIFNGANKSVCAYIMCTELDIIPSDDFSEYGDSINYNPRVNPFWTNHKGDNIDNFTFDSIITQNNKLYINKI